MFSMILLWILGFDICLLEDYDVINCIWNWLLFNKEMINLLLICELWVCRNSVLLNIV